MSDDNNAIATFSAAQLTALPTILPRDYLIEQATSLVGAYVSNNPLPAAELPKLIGQVYAAIETLGAPPAEPAAPLEPLMPIKKTVTPDGLVSLEDGKTYKTLKRHLAGRGLTPEQYRQKWGLPHDYPMVAASYSAQRSALAKSTGLGQRPQPQA